MLGEDCNWVRNVRAADGAVKLRHGHLEAVQLVEVPVRERAPVLKRYLKRAPGARPTSRSTTALSSARSRRSRTATPCSESQPRDRQPSRAHHSNSDPLIAVA
jgi:hypothetical protein